MWTFLQTPAARTTLSGVAVAATCGVLLGAALHPDLQRDGLVAPQTLIAGGGLRSGAASEVDHGLARYGDHVPDYVIGTDRVRPPLAAAQAPLAEPPTAMIYTSRDQHPEQLTTRAHWPDESAAPVAYPSGSGGVVYETDLPAPPAPPEDEDEAG